MKCNWGDKLSKFFIVYFGVFVVSIKEEGFIKYYGFGLYVFFSVLI